VQRQEPAQTATHPNGRSFRLTKTTLPKSRKSSSDWMANVKLKLSMLKPQIARVLVLNF
jgi:hypothetical protein